MEDALLSLFLLTPKLSVLLVLSLTHKSELQLNIRPMRVFLLVQW